MGDSVPGQVLDLPTLGVCACQFRHIAVRARTHDLVSR